MPSAKKKETYSQAISLADKIKEANGLIAFCQSKLTKADTEIEKILAERLESEE